MPLPLPQNPYNFNTEPAFSDAFSQCIQMETDANVNGNEQRLILARCLGFLMQELPQEASELVANEIVACLANFDQMSDLALFYINHLIRLFRRNKGRTPAPSQHPSRPSFELHSGFFW